MTSVSANTSATSAPSTPTAASENYSNKRKASQAALKQLIKPVQGRLLVCRILAFASCIIAVAPYVALTHIGDLLLNNGSHDDIKRSAVILVYAFLTQAFLYTLARYFALRRSASTQHHPKRHGENPCAGTIIVVQRYVDRQSAQSNQR